MQLRDKLRPSVLVKLIEDAPQRFTIEVCLIVVILYILFVKKSYDPKKRGFGGRRPEGLSQKEIDELVATWEPEPLVSKKPCSCAPPPKDIVPYIISEFEGSGRSIHVKIENDPKSKTIWTSQDFLGLGASKDVHETAKAAVERYTVGSCGPRGFYGTTTPHLQLEDAIARAYNVVEAITYSDATATITSVIPAFAKRGDVLLIDKSSNIGIFQGASLSRARVILFDHNDMKSLEEGLKSVAMADKKRDLSLQQRRFIVVEGIYANTGELAPLAEIVALAKKYKWRIILDDSLGVGVLGKNGLGSVEHANLTLADVDVVVGSLSTSLGSVGGFCVGSHEVVDHQRLSGMGYCFSASAPPSLCAIAHRSLQLMLESPDTVEKLRKRNKDVHQQLTTLQNFKVVSDPLSAIKHLVLKNPEKEPVCKEIVCDAAIETDPRKRIEDRLGKIVKKLAHEHDVLVSSTRTGVTRASDPAPPPPALKFSVTLRQSDDDMKKLLTALKTIDVAVGNLEI